MILTEENAAQVPANLKLGREILELSDELRFDVRANIANAAVWLASFKPPYNIVSQGDLLVIAIGHWVETVVCNPLADQMLEIGILKPLRLTPIGGEEQGVELVPALQAIFAIECQPMIL